MDIQATISKLQSDIKHNANYIHFLENEKLSWLSLAKSQGDVIFWRNYHTFKDEILSVAKQQKIDKSLYKLMCTIQKQMPNGSISMAQIREM